MTQISFWQPAGENERFASHAWDGQLGKQVPLKGPGGEDLGLCTLVSAEVAEDGSGVMLTIEVPDSFSPDRAIPMSGMGFAFREPEPLPRETVSLEAVRPRITWKT